MAKKRRRLKKKYRIALWVILAAIAAIIVLCNLPAKKSGDEARSKAKSEKVTKPVVQSRYLPTIRNLRKQFNDINPKHLAAGKKYGLKRAPENRDDVHTGDLVEIKTCKNYVVDDLDYSVPYLSKSGKLLLDEIGRNFADSLASKGIFKSRFIVTSVLRTKEDVKSLRRSGNVNASENSAHCHGGTFDISWSRWSTPAVNNANSDQLRGVLAEVLRDIQNNRRCYVKYEEKQACFHITSRIDPKYPKKLGTQIADEEETDNN